MPEYPERPCDWCGEMFVPRDSRQIFHSAECREIARKARQGAPERVEVESKPGPKVGKRMKLISTNQQIVCSIGAKHPNLCQLPNEPFFPGITPKECPSCGAERIRIKTYTEKTWRMQVPMTKEEINKARIREMVEG